MRATARTGSVEIRATNGSERENHPASPWRGFGWLMALWLLGATLFILFFAAAT
jgi:hypothetical protein